MSLYEPKDSGNRPVGYFGDVSSIKGWPDPSYTKGQVVAYRQVFYLNRRETGGPHIGIALWELFPNRRLWINLYNVDHWEGWSLA